MKRIEFIDVAKGITILLVIVGHTIPEGLIRTLIYSFHMPLFFFLSGYFYRNIPTKVLIRKKARQLLPPYYITSACLIIFNAGMLFIRQKTDELLPSTARLFFAALYGSGMDIHSPFPIPQIGAIWFLWALFFCFILMNLLYPLRYQPVLLILLAVLGIYSSFFLWLPLSFQAALPAVSFLYLGYQARQQNVIEYLQKNVWIVFLFLPIWFLTAAFGKEVVMAVNDYKCLPLNFVSAVTGIILILMLSLFLTNHTVQTKDYLKTMGENTLLILCVHLLELRIFPWYLIKNFTSEKLTFTPWLTAAVICLFKISIATIAVTVKRKIRSYSCKYKKSL